MSPDQDPGILAKLLEWAWLGVVGLVGIVWKHNNEAIVKAQNTASAALSKDDFEKHVKKTDTYFEEYAHRAETSRTELREAIVDLYKGQGKIAESLARIEGKLEK